MALAIVTPVKAAQQQYVPTQEDIEITKNIKDIQTAGYYSTALMKNGDLWTWGSMRMDDTYKLKIVLHNNFYAVIKNDGTIWTWGVDRYGNFIWLKLIQFRLQIKYKEQAIILIKAVFIRKQMDYFGQVEMHDMEY